ncbi:MAG: hypothetical protein WC323_03850 [Patescibacteria group bacterium]|jgi:hypothetical protein
MITALKWVALPMLKPEKVLAMFKDNFGIMLKLEEYDLWEKVKAVLLGLPFIEDRDEFKGKLRNTLNSSQTHLTSDKIKGAIRPTVENWIKDYVGVLGNEKADKQKQADYFSGGDAIKRLRLEEKKKVIDFFRFYEKLKLSSGTVEGTEETIPINTDDFSGIIKDGAVLKDNPEQKRMSKIFQSAAQETLAEAYGQAANETVETDKVESRKPASSADGLKVESTTTDETANEKELTQLQSMANQYPAGSLERRAIEEEVKKLKSL